jgi:hypothetical protein
MTHTYTTRIKEIQTAIKLYKHLQITVDLPKHQWKTEFFETMAAQDPIRHSEELASWNSERCTLIPAAQDAIMALFSSPDIIKYFDMTLDQARVMVILNNDTHGADLLPWLQGLEVLQNMGLTA